MKRRILRQQNIIILLCVNKIFKKLFLCGKTKVKLSIVRLTFTYDRGQQLAEIKLKTFENQIPRKIRGLVSATNDWCTSLIGQPYHMVKVTPVTSFIKCYSCTEM